MKHDKLSTMCNLTASAHSGIDGSMYKHIISLSNRQILPCAQTIHGLNFCGLQICSIFVDYIFADAGKELTKLTT